MDLLDAVESLFANAVPLTTLPTDPEANLANYEGSKMVRQVPLWQPIYKGMRVIITKNLNKETGYVNGMRATVLGVTGMVSWCAQIRVVASSSITGHRLTAI